MKGFNSNSRLVLLAFFILLTTSINAQASTSPSEESTVDYQAYFKGMKVYLLTCGPGEKSYSLFGHTAIRVRQPMKGDDIVINYGIFSFAQDYFVLRFVFGITDYKMGICGFTDFEEEYRNEGRWVYQQELNLSTKEKELLARAIDINYEPQNRTYRYNCFYNNCTTKARDIIADNINGEIIYTDTERENISFRDLCHSKTYNHRWSQFGNDLLLGIKADLPVDRNEQQFLPENLMKDFRTAVISDNNGNRRKLVCSEGYILKNTNDQQSVTCPWTTPRALIIFISLLIICVTLYEVYSRKTFWLLNPLLLSTTGLAGIILFVMIFSQHPTVNINLQILILNPISIFMAIPLAKRERKGYSSWWHTAYIICLTTGIVAGLFQHFAEGILILALSLLIRFVITYRRLNAKLPEMANKQQ